MHKEVMFARKEQKKTIQEVADFLNISSRTYWAKEHGLSDFTLNEALKLSKCLQKSIVELFPDFFYINCDKNAL